MAPEARRSEDGAGLGSKCGSPEWNRRHRELWHGVNYAGKWCKIEKKTQRLSLQRLERRGRVSNKTEKGKRSRSGESGILKVVSREWSRQKSTERLRIFRRKEVDIMSVQNSSNKFYCEWNKETELYIV